MAEEPKDQVKRTTKENIARRLGPMVKLIDDRALTVRDKWLKQHHAWMAQRDEFFYDSEFQHFIPEFRRVIERTVNRTVQQLIPHDEFFQAYPGSEVDPEADIAASGNMRYMDWLLQERVKIDRVVEQLSRTYYLYGRAIAKTGVEIIDIPQVTQGRISGGIRQIWPTARAVDPFDFHIWPETVSTVDDALLVFENILMPYGDYQRAVERGVADNIPRNKLTNPTFPTHLTERLDTQGLGAPEEMTQEGQTQPKEKLVKQQLFVQLTEAFLHNSDGSWTHIWLVWNVPDSPQVTRVHRAGFPRAPYRFVIDRQLPGEQYTPGLGEDLYSLQILLNDQFNMGEESRAVASGPPVAVHPGLIRRTDQLLFGYRRKWPIDPAGVKVLEIPDTSANSFRAVQFSIGLMSDLSGGATLQGQPPRGMPRGSQAASQLISLAGADLVKAAKTIEKAVLTPLLQDLYNLTLAYSPPDQILKIPGAENAGPLDVTISDLYGNWNYKWVSALGVADIQARAQGLMVMFQNLTRIAPLLQQQGFRVDWATLIRVLWKDVLGERRLSNVISRMTPDERAQEALFAQAAQNPALLGQPLGEPGPAPSGARAATGRPARERVGGGG